MQKEEEEKDKEKSENKLNIIKNNNKKEKKIKDSNDVKQAELVIRKIRWLPKTITRENLIINSIPHFSITSYNILAQVYTRSEQFPTVDRRWLKQSFRSENLLKEMWMLDSDIFCFQEMDQPEFWQNSLFKLGYNYVYKKRSGDKKDGVSIFWRDSKFTYIMHEEIDYDQIAVDNNNPMLAKHNAGIIVILEHKESLHKLCIATTHMHCKFLP